MSKELESAKKEATQTSVIKSIESNGTVEKKGKEKVDVVQIKLPKAKIQIMKTTYDSICDMMETLEVDFQRALAVFADMGSLSYASVKEGMMQRAKDAADAIQREVDG